MVSYQGTFQPFDDSSFLACPPPFSRSRSDVQLRTYPSATISGYLQKYHPKFMFLVQLSKLDWQMADPSFRGTLFVPRENSIDESSLLVMDQSRARLIVKYHLLTDGTFPREVLSTSLFQQLETAVPGSPILAFWDQDRDAPSSFSERLCLNTSLNWVDEFDIACSNGLVHCIRRPMMPFEGAATTCLRSSSLY